MLKCLPNLRIFMAYYPSKIEMAMDKLAKVFSKPEYLNVKNGEEIFSIIGYMADNSLKLSKLASENNFNDKKDMVYYIGEVNKTTENGMKCRLDLYEKIKNMRFKKDELEEINKSIRAINSMDYSSYKKIYPGKAESKFSGIIQKMYDKIFSVSV